MFRRMIRAFSRRDEGSALMAVIGFFGVAVVIGIFISTVTLNALGFTSATRAGVQAVAAAEAGIDYAVATLSGGTCSSHLAPSTHPEFFVDVSYSLQTTGSVWVTGCPGAGTAQRMRFVSTGTATATGVAGNTSGDTRKVEAIYLAPATDTSIQATGTAIYSYSTLDFSGSGTLQTVEAAVPSVYVKHGNVNCSGGSVITGNLVVASGTLTVNGSCAVGGSAWTSGLMNLSGGAAIGGNAVSAAGLTFTNGSITGDAWASGLMTLGWGSSVRSVTAQTIQFSGGQVSGSGWASGAATFSSGVPKIGGSLTAQQVSFPSGKRITDFVSGTATIVPSGPGAGPVPPPIPIVPNWVDFSYDPAGWSGFRVTTLGGACDWTAIQAAATAFAASSGIIDARSCTSAVNPSDYRKLTLTGDLAIIGKSFNLSGAGVTSSSGSHHLWLITPDSVADGQPTCSSGLGNTNISGAFAVDPSVSAMIYTPCQINETGSGKWYGQMYGNTATLSGAAKLAYVPVGLPGVNLNDGTVSGGGGDATTSLISSQLSIRDLASGG